MSLSEVELGYQLGQLGKHVVVVVVVVRLRAEGAQAIGKASRVCAVEMHTPSRNQVELRAQSSEQRELRAAIAAGGSGPEQRELRAVDARRGGATVDDRREHAQRVPLVAQVEVDPRLLAGAAGQALAFDRD